VLSPDGQLALQIGRAETMPVPTPLPLAGEFSDVVLMGDEDGRLFISPLTEGSQTLGTMVLVLPLSQSQTVIKQILLSLTIAIPIILLLSVAGGLFLADRALKPVTDMTQTAQQISAADLSQRLNQDLPDDEIGNLAQTFNDLLARLEAAFQRERQLTSDVSHELRTPLGMLKTQLSLARSRPREGAALLKMMDEMEGDVDRMTHLIEQMLTLARVEQYGLVNFSSVDLAELLVDSVAKLQSQAQKQVIQLLLERPFQVNLELSGDSQRLAQLFTNLIENGLKYTPPGGQVKVSISRQWQEITVTISDTGIGIAPDHLPHLFDRFYRVDDARTRETGGFGLGLAIAQTIVQAHGGLLTVKSVVDQGTTFTISLPIKQ
jgi:heavy metal sensor kinase